MQAAAHGKSNLGIPKDVGQEFVNADKKRSGPFKLPKIKKGRSKK